MKEKKFKELENYAVESFKDHIATYTELDGINVLKWSKPDSSNYMINFVFHENFIYVSGDLREAIYDCTWETSLRNSWKNDYGYFTGKLSTAEYGKFSWDGDVLSDNLTEWKKEKIADYIDCNELENIDNYEEVCENCENSNTCSDKKLLDNINEFIESAESYTSDEHEWIAFLRDCNLDEIQEEECDSPLWEFGHDWNGDLIYYWVALKMAAKQIYGIKPGSKVYNEQKHVAGIVKSLADDGKRAFVWYHTGCTASGTKLEDLVVREMPEHKDVHAGCSECITGESNGKK